MDDDLQTRMDELCRLHPRAQGEGPLETHGDRASSLALDMASPDGSPASSRGADLEESVEGWEGPGARVPSLGGQDRGPRESHPLLVLQDGSALELK